MIFFVLLSCVVSLPTAEEKRAIHSLLMDSQSQVVSSFFASDSITLEEQEKKGYKLIDVSQQVSILLNQETHRISFNSGKTWTSLIQNKGVIKLRYKHFDPLEEKTNQRKLPNVNLAPKQSQVSVIVQFFTQVLQVYKQILSNKLEAKVHFTLADNSVVITLPRNKLSELEILPFVRWVGDFLPEYKVSESIMSSILNQDQSLSFPQRFNLMLLERGKETQKIVSDMIVSQWIGGKVFLTIEQGFRMGIVLQGTQQIIQVLNLPWVMYLDEWTEPSDDMDIVRLTGGIQYLSTVADYNGERIRAEVLDSGLYLNHGDFKNNPPILHGSNCASVSHGSSVYGIVFGDGTGNPRATGNLPKAEAGIFACYSALGNRYNHTQDLVDPSGIYRAVFQTNSWGDAQTSDYTSISAEMDDIIFNTDLLILQSQSNTGTTASRPQAWAKNIFSVGGFYHYSTLSKTDDTWNNGASIGFAKDGRHKPDVSHFYDAVITTSSNGPAEYTSFSGTSAATPITAGHVGILHQLWADGVFSGSRGRNLDPFDSRPHSSTVKALMINSADQFPFDTTTTDLNRKHQGWGVVNVGTLFDAAQRSSWRLPLLVDESYPIAPLQTLTFQVYVPISRRTSFLKVTLVYRDPIPILPASQQIVNNLDLYVQSPTGTLYWGNNGLNDGTCSLPGGQADSVDNVENVIICDAVSGYWTVYVYGAEIVEDTYPGTPQVDAIFSLVATYGR